MNFQLRVTRDWCDLSNVYHRFSDESVTSFIFKHPPDDGVSRLHHHMYFFGYRQSENTARKFMKELGLNDPSGNPDWALSQSCGKRGKTRPVDISGAWIYGTTEHLYEDAFNLRKNLSPVRVEELKALAKSFWDGGVVELNGVSVRKPREKSEKDDKYKIVEEIIHEFKKHKCDRNCDESQHLHHVYEIAIKLLRARRIRWHSYDLDRYVLPAYSETTNVDQAAFISAQVRKNLRQ